MSIKLSMVRTKTLESDSADGLDGAIAEFLRTLQEEQLLELQFEISRSGPPKYVVFIAYTS